LFFNNLSEICQLHIGPVIAKEVLGKIIPHHPVEIGCGVTECVSLTRKHHKIKSLIGFYQGISNSERISGMYIIINVTMNQQQVTLQIFCQILVLFNSGFKSLFSLFLFIDGVFFYLFV